DHARRFFVSCAIQDERFGPWEGKTRKEAEQNAAREVFHILHERNSAYAAILDQIAGLTH
ncbi:MAG: putative dsRNA-binding protein, partial [Rectinema sp.]|nr:putative dsRNA-binding protein [Rectinema sp.]